MKLIRHEDVRRNIAINLIVAPKFITKRFGVDSRLGQEDLLDAIMSVLARCVIVEPDQVGFHCSVKHGQFGVTEPHPFPDLVDPEGNPLRFPELGL